MTRDDVRELKKLITKHANAVTKFSWKGVEPPESWEALATSVKVSKKKLDAHIHYIARKYKEE